MKERRFGPFCHCVVKKKFFKTLERKERRAIINVEKKISIE